MYTEMHRIASALLVSVVVFATPALLEAEPLKRKQGVIPPVVRLQVDTNGDGTINNTDDPNRLTKGAYYNVNYDRDAGPGTRNDSITFNDQGVATTPYNVIIDGAADVEDITPIKIIVYKGTESLFSVTLKVETANQAKAIHLFPTRTANAAKVFGGPAEAGLSVRVDDPLNNFAWNISGQNIEDTFGIEGLYLKGMNMAASGFPNLFNGEIKLTLEVKTVFNNVFTDTIKLRVAPFVLLPNNQTSTKAYSATWNDGNYYTYGIENALTLTGSLTTYANPNDGNLWAQDHAEIGYTQRPSGPKTILALRTPYDNHIFNELPNWTKTEFLTTNVGYFQLGYSLALPGESRSGDYGGNIEVVPGNSTDGIKAIVIGDSASAALKAFLNAQGPVAELPTSWLAVGHVDEFMGFGPGASTSVIFADPFAALNIVNNLVSTGKGLLPFFDCVDLNGDNNTETPRTPITGLVAFLPYEYPEEEPGTYRIYTNQVVPDGDYKYIRIVKESRATSSVARIVKSGPGFIDIDYVWLTTGRILTPFTPPVGDPYGTIEAISGSAQSIGYYARHDASAPPQTTSYSNWVNSLDPVMLNAVPDFGDKFVVVEDSLLWKNGMPAIVTCEEIADDALFDEFNANIGLNLIDTQMTLEGEVGQLPDGGWKNVPVLFVGTFDSSFDTSHSAFALTPGMANFQVNGGTVIFPKQFAPRVSGQDQFEAVGKTLYPTAKFADGWLYHINVGEIHCGSNVKRSAYSFEWFRP